MYLSKLEIIGFKSFAQKVNLVFDSGISAIVGPNGCGKTNIVDAIRWVLGEQRYSALRSDKMEDVIFNGTKLRKPLGMAEASLVIENTKGILPSEYTQVTVSRRVYRSGESEYLLNKVPCRLKDILDLFMDTGMGSDAYSVIELKMVETILSDKADERRRLFEEAAGVTKYKHRRKAAYRKLDDVRADLTRVNDIVTEVQKAVSSLERQARKAEQYNTLKTRLRELEIDLMEREYAHLLGRMGPVEEQVTLLGGRRSDADLSLSEGESRLEALRLSILEVEKRLAEAQRDVSLHREKTHYVEQQRLVGAERVSALRATVQRLEREQTGLVAELGRLGVQRTSLRGGIAGLETEERHTAGEHARVQEELRSFETALESGKKELQGLNERTIALVHGIAERQREQDGMKARAEHLSGRSGHAAEEIGAYEEELARLDQKVSDLSAEDRQLRRAFTEAEMRYYDAERLRQEMASRIEGMQQKVLEARGEVERRTARMDFLQGLIDSREGLPEGVRFLSSTEQWDRMQTVADALHAEERLRPALEAALGDFAGCIIVQHAAEALEAVRLLKEGEHGKATFICLDRIPAITSRCALPPGSGVVGWAASLAAFDESVAPLFRFLFDRVLIVETQEAARRLAALMPGVRCVTLDGELESGAGLSRGGSRRYDEGGMIGKRAQMTDLQSEVRQLQQALEQLEAEREAVQREHDAIDLKALNDAVKAVEKEMNGAEMRIAQMEFEKKRAADIVSRNREEIAVIEAEAAALRSEIEGSIPGLEALKDEKTGVERSYGASSAGLETLEREWNDRSTAARDLGIAVVRARNELENARSALERAEVQTDELHIAIARHKADAVTAGEAIAATEAQMAEHEAALDALQGEFSALLAAQSAAEKEAAAVRGESHRIELSIRDQRRMHDDTLKDLHEHELQLQDLRAKIEHLTARAREEFELTLERKAYPDDAFVDFAALRDEVPALRDKVKSLGNINFAAFEEYSGEKQRYETLSVQRQDLLEAEKNLLATIEEINTTAQNQFLETFGRIRTNFIDTFKSLFDPGDECDLKLEDEVDPLEARIEIVAKPRGKRPTSIDLLSGGEKTLTAIALLFAIYLVKPSPFCILDEVDAPLDDANIDRFTRIIRKFSNNTQFIVVTHNKRTMESANAMYGVTMEEEGVSKIVTVRFNQGGMAQSAALAVG